MDRCDRERCAFVLVKSYSSVVRAGRRTTAKYSGPRALRPCPSRAQRHSTKPARVRRGVCLTTGHAASRTLTHALTHSRTETRARSTLRTRKTDDTLSAAAHRGHRHSRAGPQAQLHLRLSQPLTHTTHNSPKSIELVSVYFMCHLPLPRVHLPSFPAPSYARHSPGDRCVEDRRTASCSVPLCSTPRRMHTPYQICASNSHFCASIVGGLTDRSSAAQLCP